MNVAEILSEFGAYYIKNDANMARIVKQLNAPSTTDTVLTPFFTDDTVYRASEARITRVLQPFQKGFTPIDGLSFKPVKIEQFKQKADHQEYPDELEGSWLGFLAGEGIDRKEWPFVRWFVEQHFIPAIKRDYELNEVYKGVFATPTPGTAGALGTAMNGLKKQINDYITASRITPIVTGAPNTNPVTWCEQVEAFADAIPDKYWDVPMQLCMAPALARRFERGYRSKYGAHTDFSQSNAAMLTNLTVIGLPSMSGSTKIWATPKDNVLKLGKKTQNMENVQVESQDRLLKIFTDWWSGVGFLIPEIVFTNDQELPA